MIPFKRVGSFLQTSPIEPAAKSRLVEFFERLSRDEYAIDPPSITPIECFESKRLLLRSIFLVQFKRQAVKLIVELVCVPFNGNTLDLGDVNDLIGSFLKYESQMTLVSSSEKLWAILDEADGISVAFIVCQDPEGLMGLAAYPKGFAADKGAVLLSTAIVSKFPGYFPPSSGFPPA